MKKSSLRFRYWAVLLPCLAFPLSGRTLPVSQGLPPGIKVADWTQIQGEYERHRHAAFPEGAGLKARSFEQQWLSRFDGGGFTVEPDGASWRWGLQLTGVDGKAKMTSDVNRIDYRWNADLDEWFLNDTRGLEHGFTLRAPRPDIRLAVRGGLEPRVTGEGIEFFDESGTARIKYTGLAAWDARGRKVKASMRVEAGAVVLTIDDRNATYPVTIDPTAQQAYLKASNARASALFGSSIAIDGDTIVVGSPDESSDATGVNGNQSDASLTDPGAAYVFVRSGTTWTQQAYLKASDTATFDYFGISVAISGDTIVVGAYGKNNYTGAAYVFSRNGTTWSQQAYLTSPYPCCGPRFGYSVAISGSTIVVGSEWEYGGAGGVNPTIDYSDPSSGAAYVFVKSGTTWVQQAYLKASNPGSDNFFGASVSIDADTIVIGAWGEGSSATGVNGNQNDNSLPVSGAAYVFVRSGTTWSQQAYLKASNTAAGDGFGTAAAVSGDTVAIGTGYTSADGAVYIFQRSGATWSQQALLTASNAGSGYKFGSALALSGDALAVGSYGEASSATGVNGNQSDNSESQAGAVYLFERSSGTWTQQAYLKASDTALNARFGYSVGLSGTTLVSGASMESGVAGNSGAGYVFLFPAPAVNVTVTTSPSGLSFTASGTGCAAGTYTAPQVLAWVPGSSCSLSVSTPQMGVGTEYLFTNWEDSSTPTTRTITAPSVSAAYSANFATYYMLTTSQGAGGLVSAGGFIAAGTNATVTATPFANFAFTNFTGDVSSAVNPLTVTMNGPKSLVANFTPTGTPLLTGSVVAKANSATVPNERIWYLAVTNTGGGVSNLRITNVEILGANPAGNLGLISLGSNIFPAAFPSTALGTADGAVLSFGIIFPATTPLTRIQIKIDLAADGGYTSSITLSNQTR